MRAMIAAAGLLLAALPGVRAANPGDCLPRGSSDFVRSQAAGYASQMMNLIDFIDRNYVRPVSKEELARAAVAGLYEAAREPVPASLWAEMANAKGRQQIEYLLTVARERLGEMEVLRDQNAVYASLLNFSSVLDPFSGLPAPDHRSSGRSATAGVGLSFESKSPAEEPDERDGIPTPTQAPAPEKFFAPLRVSDVLPGSPAQRAGIRPGDVLTSINDFPVDSPEGERQFQFLSKYVEGSDKFKLVFERPGAAYPMRLDLTAVTFAPETVFGVRRRSDNSWDFMLDRNRRIGYVRLGFIDSSSDDEMAEAIAQLKSEGMRGLIFDLRGCPGGFLDPAKAISGMFIKSGRIATYTDRSEDNPGRAAQDFRIDNGSGVLEGIATIVLIDEETRGGGEMVAAVLQDHNVARMAGQRTYGKGSVQRTFPFPELGVKGLVLTTGSFTRPNGKNLQRNPDSRDQDDWGIRPDRGLEYPVSPELSRQIKDWMKQQALRPGDARYPLPLDDPDNDPPRAFACRELSKQIK